MSDTVRILQSPELGWFVDRLAVRIEQGRTLEKGCISVPEVTPAQRRSIDNLLGRRSTAGRNLVIDLGKLGLANLEEAVVKLRGPLTNRRAERGLEAAAWKALFSMWRQRVSANDAALRWLEKLELGGLLKRYGENAGMLLEQAWKVIDGVPHSDILLASLAAQVSGDSHALDRGRPLSWLCLRAIFEREGIGGSRSAEARKDAWAAVGVSIDDLSSPVLCLNLRTSDGSDLAPWIEWHAARGEPFYLTPRLVGKFVADPELRDVYVCENPAVVSEAANRLGARSRALVCLNGIPSASTKSLLRHLSEAGLRLHLRADFDWAGLSFIDPLLKLENTYLWRMDAENYANCQPGQPLKGMPFKPRWAVELAEAMTKSGSAAYEEDMVDVLISDLNSKNSF